MLHWTLQRIELPLKITWAISRSSCDVKHNFLVQLWDENALKGQGEVAFNSRYGESLELVKNQFSKLSFANNANFLKNYSIEEFSSILDKEDLCPSLRFAIEAAYTQYVAYSKNLKIPELLAIPELSKEIPTSFSIPILPIEKIGAFIKEWNLQRFEIIKIKIGGIDSLDSIYEVVKHFKGTLRIDANEYFSSTDEFLAFENACKHLPIEFMEQPFPSQRKDLYRELKGRNIFPLMADESITTGTDLKEIAEYFDAVNIKLMKSGGFQKALKQIEEAKRLNLKIMLGCMIETTFGISSALYLAPLVDYIDLDGFLFLKQDPFSLVEERNGRLFFTPLTENSLHS